MQSVGGHRQFSWLLTVVTTTGNKVPMVRNRFRIRRIVRYIFTSTKNWETVVSNSELGEIKSELQDIYLQLWEVESQLWEINSELGEIKLELWDMYTYL